MTINEMGVWAFGNRAREYNAIHATNSFSICNIDEGYPKWVSSQGH